MDAPGTRGGGLRRRFGFDRLVGGSVLEHGAGRGVAVGLTLVGVLEDQPGLLHGVVAAGGLLLAGELGPLLDALVVDGLAAWFIGHRRFLPLSPHRVVTTP